MYMLSRVNGVLLAVFNRTCWRCFNDSCRTQPRLFVVHSRSLLHLQS